MIIVIHAIPDFDVINVRAFTKLYLPPNFFFVASMCTACIKYTVDNSVSCKGSILVVPQTTRCSNATIGRKCSVLSEGNVNNNNNLAK